MTIAWWYAFLAVWLILEALIVVSVWLCYRRTGIRGFLFLGAILVLWPWIDGATDALLQHFVDQVLEGHQPWLFPFSLMVRGDAGFVGWQMSPGAFLTKFWTAKQLLLVLSLALAFAFIARSFRFKTPEQQAP